MSLDNIYYSPNLLLRMAPKHKSKKQLKAEAQRRKEDRGSFDETVPTTTDRVMAKENLQAPDDATPTEIHAPVRALETHHTLTRLQSASEVDDARSTASTVRAATNADTDADSDDHTKSTSGGALKTMQPNGDAAANSRVTPQPDKDTWCNPCLVA